MSLLKRYVLSSILVVLTISASAAQLVRDINTLPTGSSAPLSHWTTIGSTTYFLMGDARYGEELWQTDGTPSGTVLVKDINPGPADSGITSMLVVGGVLYFFANDGTNGFELWRSDGTMSSTRIAADIYSGSVDGVNSSEIATMNGVVYFVGADATGGTELWRSDGTNAGTYRVSDICGGNCSSDPHQLVVSGSRLFFAADDSKAGTELWVSDGSSAGTHRVIDIYDGSTGSDPQGLTATSVGAFFTAQDASHGRELWFAPADGSKAQLVIDMTPGTVSTEFSVLGVLGTDVVFGAISQRNPSAPPGSVQVDHNIYRANSSGVQILAQNMPLYTGTPVPQAGFITIGGKLLFAGSDPATPPSALWVTDGTAGGTRRLGESRGLVSTSLIGPGAGDLGGLIGADGFYFLGYTGAAGSSVDLWRTDGTEAGTLPYAQLPQPFVATGLAQFQGRIFFAGGQFGAHGSEPWSTDGTPAGTAEFADLIPGPGDFSPSAFFVAGPRLLFAQSGQLPWASDGTVAGTRSLLSSTTYRTMGSDPQQFTSLGSRVVFYATDATHGIEPWVSDGTAAGTMLLNDILPGAGGSIPFMLGTAGSLAFFSATDATHGNELWATDGTAAGTRLVKDIAAGQIPSNPGTLSTAAALNGTMYFSANDGIHGVQLWRSDGTSAGTFAVTNLGAGLNSCMGDMHALNGKVVFRLCEATGNYWWQSDGTATGTQRVSAAVATTSSSTSVILNGYLYFGGQAAPFSAANHGQLWRTDGTAAGTTQVTDLNPGAAFTAVDSLRSMPSHVLFQYCATGSSCLLMSSDGTTAGTVAISSDTMGGESAVAGNRLVYVTAAPSGTLALQATDGTAGGTVNLLSTKSAGEFLGALASIQGQVLFTRIDPTFGPSVWRTDGTAGSTMLVADVDPDAGADFVPYGYTSAGSQVFFQGFEARVGTELYIMDIAAPNASDDVASVASGGVLTIPVSANDGSISSAINGATVTVVSQPGGGAVSAVPSSGSITYASNTGFSGSDQFTYTIADTAGHVSAPATVFVTVAQPAGAAPGTQPAPPSNPPPSSPPSSGGTNSGKGGGGGMTGVGIVFLAALLAAVYRRRIRSTPYRATV